MKTTLIVLGESVTPSNRKPIEFHRMLNTDGEIERACSIPSAFRFVELVSRSYCADFDVMFAYDNTELRNNGTLYLGKWNDGVIE